MWAMTRRFAGAPLDWLDVPSFARVLPWSMRRRTGASISLLTTGRLRRHGVPRSTRRFGDDIVAVSDAFPRAVRSGLIDVRPGISRAEGNRVDFSDGSNADADVIVHATGFALPTTFLPAEARPEEQPLYHAIAHTQTPDLYFVGLVEAHRALLPIAAMQALWTADVLAGRIDLPAAEQRALAAQDEARRRVRDFGSRREYFVDGNRYIADLRRERSRAVYASAPPGSRVRSATPGALRSAARAARSRSRSRRARNRPMTPIADEHADRDQRLRRPEVAEGAAERDVGERPRRGPDRRRERERWRAGSSSARRRS